VLYHYDEYLEHSNLPAGGGAGCRACTSAIGRGETLAARGADQQSRGVPQAPVERLKDSELHEYSRGQAVDVEPPACRNSGISSAE